MGAPRPDIRRVLEPLGPVVVFAASNFSFAFSVAGGDTATVFNDALAAADVLGGVFALVLGAEAGATAWKDPRVNAGGFTGSIPGGRAHFDMENLRPEPIPFFGKLGSNNPVFVTSAAAERGAAIAGEFVGSFTMGAGQFCTKPGTIFVPGGYEVVASLRGTELLTPAALLNKRIQSGYVEVLESLSSHDKVSVLTQETAPLADPASPTLLLTTADDLRAHPGSLQTECFGPTGLVVEYTNEAELVALADSFEGQLIATTIGNNDGQVAEVLEVLARKAGRVLWNQVPTGVSATYTQQHGGLYPATAVVGSTPVGTAAISRFLCPVAYQGFPQSLLPEALQHANPLNVPQTINGKR